MNHYKAEQQAYNGCRSILKLADSYSSKQLEEACHMALLIDAETDSKHNHKIERLIENANFGESKASVTQIKYYADRQLNKDQIERLATNEYIN